MKKWIAENWIFVIQVIIVIAGWFFVNWFSQNRDLKIRKRELITDYLIEAYRNIEDICGRESLTTEEQKRKIEQAIANIQLFGSSKQISLAKKFIEKMNKDSSADPRILLAELRNSLRKELGLEPASDDPKDILHWRILNDASIKKEPPN